MPQQPLSTTTPYCSVEQFLRFHDWEQVADLVRDGSLPRPTRADLLDANTSAGQLVLQAGLAASGMIESACVIGRRYRPADLQALTGAGRALLEKVTADLWFYLLSQRRMPYTGDPKAIPGAQAALDFLEALRKGDHVFPTEETAEAGLPKVTGWQSEKMIFPLSVRAQRFFGFRDPRTL